MQNRPKPPRGTQPHHLSPRSPRILVAWLPFFRLERCGWNPNEAVVLVQSIKGVLRVQATSASAHRGGIHNGMSVPEARSILPGLHLEHLDSIESERHDLNELCTKLEGLAPHPQHMGVDTLFVRIDNTAPQIGGESACIEMAMRQLRSLGHLSRIWIVDGDRTGSVHAARALARWKHKHQIIAVNELASALKDLPLRMLPMSPDIYESLHALGIRSAGALAQIPPASLAHRYGSEGTWLGRVCRAEKTSLTLPPTDHLQKKHSFKDHFEAPVSNQKQLLQSLKNATKKLSKSLSEDNQACQRLHLRLHTEEGDQKDIQMRFSQAQQNTDAFFGAIEQSLENLRLEGCIESYQIEALNLSSYSGARQKSLLDRSMNQEDFDVLFERLSRDLHTPPIVSPRINHQHRPERAWDCAKEPTPNRSLPESCRPTLMLPQSVSIRVQLQYGVPSTLEIDGRRWSVVEAQGPERICGDWWRPSSFHRDYWRVYLSDGRLLWIFCDKEEDCWWLQGFFE